MRMHICLSASISFLFFLLAWGFSFCFVFRCSNFYRDGVTQRWRTPSVYNGLGKFLRRIFLRIFFSFLIEFQSVLFCIIRLHGSDEGMNEALREADVEGVMAAGLRALFCLDSFLCNNEDPFFIFLFLLIRLILLIVWIMIFIKFIYLHYCIAIMHYYWIIEYSWILISQSISISQYLYWLSNFVNFFYH